eukprot:22666-Pelagomonas_calceolata.AAC.1
MEQQPTEAYNQKGGLKVVCSLELQYEHGACVCFSSAPDCKFTCSLLAQAGKRASMFFPRHECKNTCILATLGVQAAFICAPSVGSSVLVQLTSAGFQHMLASTLLQSTSAGFHGAITYMQRALQPPS